MLKTLFTLFSVFFIIWVVFGTEAGDAKGDKKKSDGKGGGLLIGLLFAPFVLLGWLMFGLAQMLLVLTQAIAALWEMITPMFRTLFEWIGKLIEWIWAMLKKLLGGIRPLLSYLAKVISYALKTVWNALEGILRAIIRILRSAFSFIGDLIRDFPGVLRTIRKIFKPLAWLLRMLRDALGKILDILVFLTGGVVAWIGMGNKKTKEYVTRDIEDTDPTQPADLLLAVPLAVATGAKRTKKRLKETKERGGIGLFPKAARLAAHDPLKKGIMKKRKESDPHVMKRLQHIGWETRRKMGKA